MRWANVHEEDAENRVKWKYRTNVAEYFGEKVKEKMMKNIASWNHARRVYFS